MLLEIDIQNFALIQRATVLFESGMTVITGETGAGKSIVLDALQLALGARGETDLIREGATSLEVSARFEVFPDHPAYETLSSLVSIEDNSLIFKRTLTNKGRSLAYINGTPATLQQLKQVSSCLIGFHGQHAHTELLKPSIQRAWLDQFGGHGEICAQVSHAYHHWQKLVQKQMECESDLAGHLAAQSLIQYQLEELSHLKPEAGEFERLHDLQRQFEHAHQLTQATEQVQMALIEGDRPLASQVVRLQQVLNSVVNYAPELTNVCELLAQAQIYLTEASEDLDSIRKGFNFEAEDRAEIESRLSLWHQLARKHRVDSAQLFEHYQGLLTQVSTYDQQEKMLAQLKQQIVEAENNYTQCAHSLHLARLEAAKKLGPPMKKLMTELGMKGGGFEVKVTASHPSEEGSDQVQIEVSTNPGQPLRPLQEVVSGGELSRLSLAFQTLTAERKTLPTLIFDEVDVGIGGATAARVGQLIVELGKRCQVICITHLPQVAAKADHQVSVDKQNDHKTTWTELRVLNPAQRVEEIARMIGGETITPETLAQARVLLGKQ